MALTLRWGTVTAVTQSLDDLIRCSVDGNDCVAYPRQTGPVEVGDTVLVNTQAQDLALGSGGFHVLYANVTRGLGLLPPPSTHVMTLPYTPGQSAAACVEENDGLADDLGGMPVVCCGLHSQVAPVVAGIGAGVRIAFAQLAGGALPVALSDTVRTLKTRGLIESAIAVSPCLDGDVQAVSVASALAWAKARGFDAVVCCNRARHRRDRVSVRSRRRFRCGGGERYVRSRRQSGHRRPLFECRLQGTAPGRLAPHAVGPSAHPRFPGRGVADRSGPRRGPR